MHVDHKVLALTASHWRTPAVALHASSSQQSYERLIQTIILITRKSDNCHLKTTGVRPVVLSCFDKFCTAHAHKLSFSPSDQNFNITNRFSDPDFLKQSSNLVIRGRFNDVTLTFVIWPWTFVVHRMSRDLPHYHIYRNPTIAHCFKCILAIRHNNCKKICFR